MGVSKIICFKAILNFISFQKLWWRRGLKYEGLTNLSFRGLDKKNCFFPHIDAKLSNFMSDAYFENADMAIKLRGADRNYGA